MSDDEWYSEYEQPARPKTIKTKADDWKPKQLTVSQKAKNIARKTRVPQQEFQAFKDNLQRQPSIQNIINLPPAVTPPPASRKKTLPKVDKWKTVDNSSESSGFNDGGDSIFSASEESSFQSPPESPVSITRSSNAFPIKLRGSLQKPNKGARAKRNHSPAPVYREHEGLKGYDFNTRIRERSLERKLLRDREPQRQADLLDQERDERDLEDMLGYSKEDAYSVEPRARRPEAQNDMITWGHQIRRAPSMERRYSAREQSPPSRPQLQRSLTYDDYPPQHPPFRRSRSVHPPRQILPAAPEPGQYWSTRHDWDDYARDDYEDLTRRQEASRTETARLEHMRRENMMRPAQRRRAPSYDFWSNDISGGRAERGRSFARPPLSESSDERTPRPLSRGATKDRIRLQYSHVRAPPLYP
ncbi:hypothetical protein AOQ84DRAFT_357168 [Glonium stellatum]|uniref:Uncharacterized protein n=1 Tax=Glonium stellatum TaxID=574774 RepID=A0A8E2EQ95_9PEZI|nr:hypothetical protein AOQ84DRAFT_357168 [Glonium stellatum]